jgi:hypothetical protein
LVVDILKHNSRQCSSGCCCLSAHVISLQVILGRDPIGKSKTKPKQSF